MKQSFTIKDLQTGDTYKLEFSYALDFWYLSNLLEFSGQAYIPTANKLAPLWIHDNYIVGNTFRSITDEGIHSFKVLSCGISICE